MGDDNRHGQPKGDGDGPQGIRRSRGLIIWFLLIGGVILIVSLGDQSGDGRDGEDKVSYTDVVQAIGDGKVKSIRVANATMHVTPREGAPDGKFPNKEFKITISPEVIGTVEQIVREHNIAAETASTEKVDIEFDEPSALLQHLLGMAPWLLILILMYYMIIRQLRSAGSGVLSFGRSRARPNHPEQGRITFDDVAGVDEAKQEVMEIIDYLKNPEKFRRVGGRVPRGVLLVGAPGSGKTLLAKAIAGEAERPFFSISGSDFVEMFVGVGASRVRDLFKQAKEHAPCIIFLDEVDAVGRRRGTGLGGGHDEREQTLNAILVEMDGFDSDAGVILIAATNRPDVLDPALLRPGRFDRRIVVDLPDVKGREAILLVHARKVRLEDDVDFKVIARGTPYFSGADLENLLNEAALGAVRAEKDAVGMSDLEEARDKVMFGPEKKSRVVAEEEKRLTAYHEAGHAVVSKLVPDIEPVHKVAIVARGMALGSTMFLPEKDRYILPRRRVLGEITSLLGGRAAEQEFCDDITTGAQNDFERATELARMMVCRWGMSERLGPMSYTDNEEHVFLGRELTKVKHVSESTAVIIDQEVRAIIDTCYARAVGLLDEHRPAVESIVDALMKYETIDGKEVDILMAGGEIVRENGNGDDPKPEAPSDGETDSVDGEADAAEPEAETADSGQADGESDAAPREPEAGPVEDDGESAGDDDEARETP